MVSLTTFDNVRTILWKIGTEIVCRMKVSFRGEWSWSYTNLQLSNFLCFALNKRHLSVIDKPFSQFYQVYFNMKTFCLFILCHLRSLLSLKVCRVRDAIIIHFQGHSHGSKQKKVQGSRTQFFTMCVKHMWQQIDSFCHL